MKFVRVGVKAIDPQGALFVLAVLYYNCRAPNVLPTETVPPSRFRPCEYVLPPR